MAAYFIAQYTVKNPDLYAEYSAGAGPTLAKYGTWPASGEIDIMEMIGRDPALVHGTLHYGNPHGSQTESYFLPTLETFDQDFHIFAIEWEPEEIRWYVDGEMYHKAAHWFTSYKDAPPGAPFDQPFYWILNVAVGGDWPGYPDEDSEFPQRMVVDYVRVWQQALRYIYIDDISMGYRKKGSFYYGQATVHIKDETGANVEDATVYGEWSGSVSDSDSGVTGPDGTVMIESPRVKSGGTFTFTVTDVFRGGCVYTPEWNVEDSDTITAP